MRESLNESFPNRWLGRGGPVAWPPRSPDLTPLDYYLWGHMKTLVYEPKVESRAALRDRIFAAAEHIDLILRVLDYIVTVSFGYILYCVFFHLYCGCFKLFCNVWVCVCGFCNVWVCMCGCVDVWVL